MNNSLYRQLVKELRAHIESLDVKLIIQYRKTKFGIDTLEGYHHKEDMKIVLTFYGQPDRQDIIHCLAHELRHAIHVNEGLYGDTYNSEHYACAALIAAGFEIPLNRISRGSNKTAWLAERDCDRWADKWMSNHGVRPIKREIYPFTATTMYQNNLILDDYIASAS